ncbi:putative odorant receptor 85e [Colias croceus]|uniref:putative odorant receptor 85e n=1 Tax=Colias crocea TaxID=72248 RepID=UPI001E27C404|nr:putative odorant receptor 85e [Colias croceus]
MKETISNRVKNYCHFMVLPLKIVGCWDWFRNPTKASHIFINNVYLAMVLFILLNLTVSLVVHLYGEWTDIMSNLDKMADGLPLIVSIAIVAYFSIWKKEMYDLCEYMNNNFKWHSARGLTNMTMQASYKTARNFAFFYTACTIFSVAMYVVLPVAGYLWFNHPLHPWIYKDVVQGPFIALIFVRQCLAQGFVALAMGQLGVFFASNSILLCGQLDLLCCSLRNVRYTALLQHVEHAAISAQKYSTVEDEQHSYMYNMSEVKELEYHYDEIVRASHKEVRFDIYSKQYDDATVLAIQDCARVCQVVYEYKQRFERFVSPLLALRVVQVTMYLCTLLYAATLKFDMITVEYLGAVALDIYVYCHFGNQIILQADRVSTAAYQSAWPSMGVAPRRLLLNVLLSNLRPVVVRAGNFLPMNLHTFVVIIKTSFSYYTLLVNVNDK